MARGSAGRRASLRRLHRLLGLLRRVRLVVDELGLLDGVLVVLVPGVLLGREVALGIVVVLVGLGLVPCLGLVRGGQGTAVAAFELLDPLTQPLVLVLELAVTGGKRGIPLPPVDTHLLGAVDRGDDQPQLDGEQLDVEEVDLDVPGDHDPLVEDALEDVGEVRAVTGRLLLLLARGGHLTRPASRVGHARPLLGGSPTPITRRRPGRVCSA